MMPTQDALFRTLADPTRRMLFERLCREGGLTVAALTKGAGVSQPAVSKHLAVLKRTGLVRDRQDGRQTHYTAEVKALAPLLIAPRPDRARSSRASSRGVDVARSAFAIQRARTGPGGATRRVQ